MLQSQRLSRQNTEWSCARWYAGRIHGRHDEGIYKGFGRIVTDRSLQGPLWRFCKWLRRQSLLRNLFGQTLDVAGCVHCAKWTQRTCCGKRHHCCRLWRVWCCRGVGSYQGRLSRCLSARQSSCGPSSQPTQYSCLFGVLWTTCQMILISPINHWISSCQIVFKPPSYFWIYARVITVGAFFLDNPGVSLQSRCIFMSNW